MVIWSTFDMLNEYYAGYPRRIVVCDDHDTLPSEIGGIVQDYQFVKRGEVSPATCCYLCDKLASQD